MIHSVRVLRDWDKVDMVGACRKKDERMPLDKKTVNEWFRYENGRLFWKKVPYRCNHLWGQPVGGTSSNRGYSMVNVGAISNRVPVALHRVIWTMFNDTPPKGMHIDHINRDNTDNRIENLRCVTPSQNGLNSSLSKNNTSGVTGVRFQPRGKKWTARVMVNRKEVHLGSFETFEEARAAREAAVMDLMP